MLDYSLVERAVTIAKPKYNQLGDKWAHGWHHISRVAETAETLAKKVGADPVACRLAAYAHDFGAFQEKDYGEGRELGNTDHALWGVVPTIEFLEELGVKGYEKGAIIAAVANHSFKEYQGRDLVGSVLRDADRADALGPIGTLRCSRHHYKEDLVGTSRVLTSMDGGESPAVLARETLELIGRREDKLRYLENLTFVLEWPDLGMFHHPETLELVRDDIEYTRQERVTLIQPEITSAIEQSRSDPRRRKAHFYHEQDYDRTQIGLNAIQPESMIRPHARSTPGSIIHLAGELVYLEFDHNGKGTRSELLNESNPHIRVPSRTFHTVYAKQDDSVLGMLVPGPHKPDDFRINPSWAPPEHEHNRNWYEKLKVI